MTFFPGLTRLPEGESCRMEEVAPGLFSFPNAYDGVYEFFPGRPIGEVREGLFHAYPQPLPPAVPDGA